MKRFAAVAIPLALGTALALEPARLVLFSTAEPGSRLPREWRTLTIPGRKAPEYALVRDGGETALRIRSEAAVGSLAHTLAADPQATPVLSWRWKVDHALEKAQLGTKEGDDFSARVYVSFDVPLETLAFADRALLGLARLVYGDDLPAAALCYVWDNRQPVGTSVWNPHAHGRLRMVVLQSGNARANEWVAQSRDVEADFQAAFGSTWRKPTPRITGVAVAADTDQTGESVTAWFGDFRLEARP